MSRLIAPPATLLAALFLAALFSCNKTGPGEAADLFQKNKTADAPGQMAHQWVELAHLMARQNSLEAPQAARIYGYTGLAMWEAVVHGIPGGRSLAGQVNDLAGLPLPDRKQEYDWGIVLSSAMEVVVPALVDGISDPQRASVRSLAATQRSEMTAKHSVAPLVEKASTDYGFRLGQRIAERAQNDGRGIIRDIVPQLPARDAQHPQYWDATTLGQTAIEPLWSTVRTFALPNSQGCEASAPLPYSTSATGNFFKEAKEIFDQYPLGFEQKAAAYHWEDGPGRTATPPGHWMGIAQQLLADEGRDLAQSARLYALVGMAVADATSAAWYQKYKFNLLRPVTYVRENIDPAWAPAINTPAYPSHVSVSAAVAGAASVVLKDFFGDVAFTDRTQYGSAIYTPDEPGVPKILPERAFASLTKAGEEAAESRITGGVSFRRSAMQGFETGRCTGISVMAKLDFE